VDDITYNNASPGTMAASITFQKYFNYKTQMM